MATVEKYEIKSGTRYRVRYRDHERRQAKKGGFLTKRDAQHWLTTIQNDLHTGKYIAPRRGRTPIQDVYREWMDITTVAPKTTVTRENTWKNHVAPRWAKTHVGDVTRPAVREWVTAMHKQGTGESTMKAALGILRMILNHAVETERLATNPAKGVPVPRDSSPEKRYYLTHAQVRALAAKSGDYAPVVRFLAYTGLRFGEMASLRVEDVNLLRRTVNVSKGTTPVRGKLIERHTKTNAARQVPVGETISDDLVAMTDGKAQDMHVFTSPGGGVLNIDNWRRRQFYPAVKACHADDPSFPLGLHIHDLRHTAASLAIAAGANVKAVQRMLGHKSATMTLDVYADLFDDDLRGVADAMDRAARSAENIG